MKPHDARHPQGKGGAMSDQPVVSKPIFTRSFFIYRLAIYLAVAFLVRESVTPARSEGVFDQSRVLSSDFAAWSSTFPSRLDRAMATGVAE